MNICIDKNIPFLAEILSRDFNVFTFEGRILKNEDLKDTDVLFVRSTTKVNEELLHNTPVRLVGTATTGTEHIDKDYLIRNNIAFGDANGCNANSVAEYVIYSILKWHFEYGNDLTDKTIGIIGFGNIGKLVAKYADLMGLRILVNDQPLYDLGFSFPSYAKHCNYETIFKESDIITNHIPLTTTDKYPTYNLINENLLKHIKENSLIIHASRGGIINEQDLLNLMKNTTLAIDVWEGEPSVNTELLRKCMVASAHTAGYSRDGKLRGVNAMLDLLSKFSGLKIIHKKLIEELSDYSPMPLEKFSDLKYVYNKLKESRNFEYDHSEMNKLLSLSKDERMKKFDDIRKNYPIRREVL